MCEYTCRLNPTFKVRNEKILGNTNEIRAVVERVPSSDAMVEEETVAVSPKRFGQKKLLLLNAVPLLCRTTQLRPTIMREGGDLS